MIRIWFPLRMQWQTARSRKRAPQPDDHEAILVARLIGVSHFKRLFVVEDGRCFFKRNTVLCEILLGLLGIPVEGSVAHTDIVATAPLRAKCPWVRGTLN